jgi:hypothetical protein
MFTLQLRSLTFTERLALCLIVLPLLLVYLHLNRVRADGDCPATKANFVPCPGQLGSAPCGAYTQGGPAQCNGKTHNVIGVNYFQCTADVTKTKMCIPEVTLDGKAITGNCWASYLCVWDDTNKQCKDGPLVGNIITAPLFKTEDCPE